MGLITYNISTQRGPIKAAHSSQLKLRLADLTGAHVNLNYTHEKLSAEVDGQEDEYLVDWIPQHRPKAGSRDPRDIEFLVQWEAPSITPRKTNENPQKASSQCKTSLGGVTGNPMTSCLR